MLSAAIQFAAWKGQPHEQVTVGRRAAGAQVRYMAESSILLQCNRCIKTEFRKGLQPVHPYLSESVII